MGTVDGVTGRPRHAGGNPSLGTMLRRGLLRRCPVCGGRGWFTGWFRRTTRCVDCGYRYERQDGFSLGAVTMNIVVTFGLLGLVLLVGSILTYPDLAVGPMLVAGFAVTIIVPIAFYPVSYTLWAAIDVAMRPLEPREVADAAEHVYLRMLAGDGEDRPGNT